MVARKDACIGLIGFDLTPKRKNRRDVALNLSRNICDVPQYTANPNFNPRSDFYTKIKEKKHLTQTKKSKRGWNRSFES